MKILESKLVTDADRHGILSFDEMRLRSEIIFNQVAITNIIILDVGLSDHFLVKCRIAAPSDRPPIIKATFRNYKRLDLEAFKQRLCSSCVYTLPAVTADAFASQLEYEVKTILDDLVPICTSTKRQQKPESRWLSAEAVAVKQSRR